MSFLRSAQIARAKPWISGPQTPRATNSAKCRSRILFLLRFWVSSAPGIVAAAFRPRSPISGYSSNRKWRRFASGLETQMALAMRQTAKAIARLS